MDKDTYEIYYFVMETSNIRRLAPTILTCNAT